MAFRIISAAERLAAPRGKKGVILGASGIGKTSLLWTLDPATTLFVNLEAGDLSVQGWGG
ncbi:AAA family ATPase, partial [Streptomyces galilaeus]|uniref:AAA family ATPase n=1 Tax=Streptomyces galilaeus TaxID=33899 RepID=UPI0038F6434A